MFCYFFAMLRAGGRWGRGGRRLNWPPDFLKYNSKTYDFLLLIALPDFQTFRHLLMLILFPSQINVLLFYICTNRMEQRICHNYQLFIIWFFWCGVPIITPTYPIYLYLKLDFFPNQVYFKLEKKNQVIMNFKVLCTS